MQTANFKVTLGGLGILDGQRNKVFDILDRWTPFARMEVCSVGSFEYLSTLFLWQGNHGYRLLRLDVVFNLKSQGRLGVKDGHMSHFLLLRRDNGTGPWQLIVEADYLKQRSILSGGLESMHHLSFTCAVAHLSGMWSAIASKQTLFLD